MSFSLLPKSHVLNRHWRKAPTPQADKLRVEIKQMEAAGTQPKGSIRVMRKACRVIAQAERLMFVNANLPPDRRIEFLNTHDTKGTQP